MQRIDERPGEVVSLCLPICLRDVESPLGTPKNPGNAVTAEAWGVDSKGIAHIVRGLASMLVADAVAARHCERPTAGAPAPALRRITLLGIGLVVLGYLLLAALPEAADGPPAIWWKLGLEQPFAALRLPFSVVAPGPHAGGHVGTGQIGAAAVAAPGVLPSRLNAPAHITSTLRAGSLANGLYQNPRARARGAARGPSVARAVRIHVDRRPGSYRQRGAAPNGRSNLRRTGVSATGLRASQRHRYSAARTTWGIPQGGPMSFLGLPTDEHQNRATRTRGPDRP